MKKIRVVVDTNIFVSALLGGRTCRGIVSLIEDHALNLLFSKSLLREVEETLTDKELGEIAPLDVERLFKIINLCAEIVTPVTSLKICRDPRDNFLLELATTAKADIIITGDKDLLVLNPFHSISIVTPEEFIAMFEKR